MYLFESHVFSEALNFNVCVNVLIPHQVKPKEKFKTLYLLHGYMGDYTDWMRLSALERYANQYRIAIVMPSAHNAYYTDTTYGYPYETFISIELPNMMESIFPLSKKKEDRMIGGLSMGGYGALKMALSPKGKFGKAFSLSGALDIEHIRNLTRETPRKHTFDGVFGKKSVEMTKHDLKYLVSKRIQKNQEFPELLITCGTEDFLFQSNEKFHDFLNENHIKHDYITNPGDHNWDYWDLMIEKVLPWVNK